MNMKEFSMIYDFIEGYFYCGECSKTELKDCVEDFILRVRENKKMLGALRKEAETLYTINNSQSGEKIDWKVGKYGLPPDFVKDIIELLYEKTRKDIKRFNTIGYFTESYFNWSKNWDGLERCLEEFSQRENQERIEAFRREVETLYLSHDSALMQEVLYQLGGRGMSPEKAVGMMKLLYEKTQIDLIEFSTVGYFIKCYFGLGVELEYGMKQFFTRDTLERMKALKKEVEVLYTTNNPMLIQEVSHKLARRGMSLEKAKSMIVQLYLETQKLSFL